MHATYTTSNKAGSSPLSLARVYRIPTRCASAARLCNDSISAQHGAWGGRKSKPDPASCGRLHGCCQQDWGDPGIQVPVQLGIAAGQQRLAQGVGNSAL